MIGWIVFVILISMLLWWLGGIMMPQHKPIIQEPNNLLRSDNE
jgi:hypothetical protein